MKQIFEQIDKDIELVRSENTYFATLTYMADHELSFYYDTLDDNMKYFIAKRIIHLIDEVTDPNLYFFDLMKRDFLIPNEISYEDMTKRYILDYDSYDLFYFFITYYSYI